MVGEVVSFFVRRLAVDDHRNTPIGERGGGYQRHLVVFHGPFHIELEQCLVPGGRIGVAEDRSHPGTLALFFRCVRHACRRDGRRADRAGKCRWRIVHRRLRPWGSLLIAFAAAQAGQ